MTLPKPLYSAQKKQKKFYSGKKKQHTIKSQVVVDKKSARIICTSFCNGKCHDFRLFKESKTHIHPKIIVITDTGYQGLSRIHTKSMLPKKRTKKRPLTPEDIQNNKNIAKKRILNEHVIGRIKRFKIVSDKYRNRRKRFRLRFNLISGIYNLELPM